MARRSRIKVVFDKVLAKRIGRDAARDGLRFAAIEGENQLVDILSVPPARSGHAYSRPGGTVHIASAPGESPAPDSGETRQSVLSFLNLTGRDLKAVVGSPLERLKILEFGTEDIEPRPAVIRLSEPNRILAMHRSFAAGVRRGQRR